ncbi:hypothetical protein C7212DRAFT_349090 [Tuber magnatum]|uniref:Uncharacterized protein n=1 Tax=Tuber magnatum TaxID=42249 RepID=A0A317SG41_9PEZI|nr:hypothetical protein C7212DRAFT_349090 [Tuber magnatum]
MPDSQSSSGATARQAPDISSLFPASDQMPKPLSKFPRATWVMYSIYLTRWHQKNDNFNNLVDSHKFLYELIYVENQDGCPDGVLESLIKTVSDAKEVLLADLGKLEESFQATCDGYAAWNELRRLLACFPTARLIALNSSVIEFYNAHELIPCMPDRYALTRGRITANRLLPLRSGQQPCTKETRNLTPSPPPMDSTTSSLTVNEDEFHDQVLELLAMMVPDTEVTSMVDLGKLGENFEAPCNGSGAGDSTNFRN